MSVIEPKKIRDVLNYNVLFDIDGASVQEAAETLLDIATKHPSYTRVYLDYDYDSSSLVIYGDRDETLEERNAREREEAVRNERRRNAEITTLRTLREKYPDA